MQNPEPSIISGCVLTGFWKIPAIPRSLTCGAMLVVGVWLAEFCTFLKLHMPAAVVICLAFLSLFIAATLRRLRWARLETGALLAAMIVVGALLWTIRSRVDEGQDIALLAASAEFRDVPALRIIGDVANIPALTVPKDVSSMTSQSELPRTLLLLRTRSVVQGEDTIRSRGLLRVLIDGDATGRLCWGDRIQLTGQIDLPEQAKNPGEFDFAGHMRRQGISGMAFARHPAAAHVIRPAGGWNPKRWFNAFRQQTVLILRDNLTSENRATAEALLLGNRGHLRPDVERDFITSGTMHLLAISGLHVGILFVFLVRIQNLLLVSRPRSLLLAGLTVVFYAMLTDLRPSVMRATCFILLYILGQTLYRDIRMGSLIGVTIMLLVLLNPSVVFDIGAWLSFLAVSALGWVSEHESPPEDRAAPPDAVTWEDQFRDVLGRLWDAAKLNYRRMVAITVLSAPLVATQFHVVSLLGMVINILLIPATSVTLISGYIAVFSGLLVPPAASITAVPFNCLLSALQICVSLAGDVRVGFVMIPDLPVWFLPVYYGLLALSVVARHTALRMCFRISLLVYAVTVFHTICRAPEHDGLTCSVLSVGHGNAVVVQTPDNRVLLFDAGAMHRGERTADTVCRFLWNRGYRMIDAIVVSHPDLDHYNAVASLLERVPVGHVLLTDEFVRTDSPAVQKVLDAILSLDVPVSILSSGDSVACEHLQISFLKADKGPTSELSDNEASVTAILEYRNRRVCLPGDLEGRGQLELLPNLPACEVLMSPHHGSPKSNLPALAEAVHPAYVIVSARNDQNRDYLTRVFSSASVLHTSSDGCVTVHVSAAGTLNIDRFRRAPVERGSSP
uniref:Putative competence protein ComEC/Rec2 n=1 Tax=uncultured bacterium A1Q1_fos_291 TaxID=1256570 RepID=L7VWT5_9BACT|nr:putative competence protein ComEC/Rec2 [uncultured bacterium A1Q1_fos_291]